MRIINLQQRVDGGNTNYIADVGCSFGSCIYTVNGSPTIETCDYLALESVNDRPEWACNKIPCLSGCED